VPRSVLSAASIAAKKPALQSRSERTNLGALASFLIAWTSAPSAEDLDPSVIEARERAEASAREDVARERAEAGARADEARERAEQALKLAAQEEASPDKDFRLDSRVCMLGDLNGDGVHELSVLVASRGERKIPTILDGATGDVHWQGQALNRQSNIHLLCLGPQWLGVVDNQQFELLVVNTNEPSREVRRALSDELYRYGVSESCLSFRMDDRQRLGLSVEDGSEMSCRARANRRPHIEDTTTCGIISTIPRGVRFEDDGVKFQLKAKRPGTPFLQVKATRGSRKLWELPLRLVPVGGEAIGCFVGVTTPGVFVVVGNSRGGKRQLTVIGLNTDAGTERYAVDTPSSFSRVNEIYYNGRHVVMGLGRQLLALNPATGQMAWEIGA